jgi:uncharacterized protein DUF6923/S-layer family protein
MFKNACTTLLVVGVALMLAPLAGASDNPNCPAMEKTALQVPEWLVSACRGGMPPIEQPAAGPWRNPGDLAMYLSNFSPNAALSRRLLTAPLPTATYANIAPCGANPLNIFALDFDLGAQVLWAIDSGCSTGVCTARSFGTINQTTGVYTVVGQIGAGPATGSNFSGLKFDPTSTLVYFSAISGTTSTIWTLNLQTGAATQVGTGSIAGLVIDIAIDRTGIMYGHEILNDQLLRIDKTTGVATVIGPTGQTANFAQGMDFDPVDNTLYGFIIRSDTTAAIGTFNTATGAFTVTAANGEELEGAVKLAAARMTPISLKVDDAGNKVMEPSEAATVAPTWRNDGSLAQSNVTGALSNFTGPAGPTYSIVDGTGAYGNVAAGASAPCTDCYIVMASGTRPAQHWDSTVTETLSVPGQTKNWVLHLGNSFSDVPNTNGFYRFIETLFHKGVTGGCGTGIYCPTSATTREQMAAFVLVAKEGAGYNPPACVPPNLFSDVPDTSPFCKFIEELANRLVVTGCGPNLYCPSAAVTREQMAVFVLKTLDPALNPPACGTPMFTDVPASSPFCKWIEELARRGVVTGCGASTYCPSDPVTREQMGVFLTVTFSLALYGA